MLRGISKLYKQWIRKRTPFSFFRNSSLLFFLLICVLLMFKFLLLPGLHGFYISSLFVLLFFTLPPSVNLSISC